MTCDRCLGLLAHGDHGLFKCPLEARGRAAGVNPDEFIGGLTLENLGPDPVTVYSRSELRRELAARNLEPHVRHVEGDKHVKSWVTMDPYTMAAAQSLAERQGHTKASRVADEGLDVTTWITEGEAFTVRG